ncbi:hypothetical protein [Cognatilysobacter lacus]|uniref:Uncharacterized protein n=1 Tax=Cognatilysobacter lacus TaxID=1643323 RepID=A0A5D8YYQ0_9GAMM|nr:hypothetical protein [Lysobacter lacus]TZF86962.1 hypothetical protein FW784_11745 [Lysobacter lacus]
MVDILNIVFMLGALVMLAVYIMYFTALHHFGRSLQAAHPQLYARFSGVRGSVFARNYAALQAIRQNPAIVAELQPSVAAEMRDTYKYLVIGVSCFMVVLFAGLGSSLIAKA